MNLFELFVKIGVDDQASGKLADIGSKLGKGLKTAAKIGVAAVGAAAAGITALTTAAVKNYAEYEQLVGGVDTLFKDASQKVQKYASEAYRTSGMSANDYMANATAFSASLISSLGGDTEKAAEYANRAMVSMSDNANRMGTSLDSIVQTYQSLSRGNMAMLDNLKLGYGGTKAELERLIADAASYTEIQKKMGIMVDATSTSFDNIVNAIAVVQAKLGIAGATAQEAGTTIEGSVNSMKAAWDNLITGVANKNADLEGLIGDLVTTIVGDGTESNLGVLGNVMPAVKSALNGASRLVSEMIPIIVQEIPTIINDNLPVLAKAAVSIVQSLVDGISENGGKIANTAIGIVFDLANSLLEMAPQIIEVGARLLIDFADGIGKKLPYIIPQIVEAFLQIFDSLTDPEFAEQIFSAAETLLIGLLNGIIDSMPLILEFIPVLLENIINGFISMAPKLGSSLGEIFGSVVPQVVMMIIEMLPSLVFQIVTTITENLGSFVGALVESGAMLIKGLIKGILSIDVGSVVKSIGRSIVNSVKGIFDIHSPSRVFDWLGRMMMEGWTNGINSGAADVLSAITGISNGVIANASSPLGGLAKAIETAITGGTGVIGENVVDSLYSVFSWLTEGVEGLSRLGDYELLGGSSRGASSRGGSKKSTSYKEWAYEVEQKSSKAREMDRLYQTYYHSRDTFVPNDMSPSELEMAIYSASKNWSNRNTTTVGGGRQFNINMTR